MKLSIRNKLLGGFSLVLLMILVMAYIMASRFSESNERLQKIVDFSAQRVVLANELLITLLEITRQEKNHLLANEVSQKQYHKSLIDTSLLKMEKLTVDLESIISEERKYILNDFKTTFDNFTPILDEILLLSLADSTEAANRLSVGKGRITRDKAIDTLKQIIARNQADMLDDKAQNIANYQSALQLIIIFLIFTILIAIGLSFWIVVSVGKRIKKISREAEKIASRELSYVKLEDGFNDELRPIFNAISDINDSFNKVTISANQVASGDYSTDFVPLSDKDLLGIALKKMTSSLRETTSENQKHNWLTHGQNQLNQKLLGDQSLQQFANNTISFLCTYLDAQIGAVYLLNEANNIFELSARYAFFSINDMKEKFSMHEGLVGQAAAEQKQISIKSVASDHLRIISSAMDAKPAHLVINPVVFEGKTLGVIELGKLQDFTDTELEFVHNSMESIAIIVNSAIARNRIQELLAETQTQSEELQSQQEELRQMNEELEEHTLDLKHQQEELQMTNEELEEQTQALDMKNREVEAAKNDIEQKSRQLEVSSKYKSEFLANMSHELRTPLNSLLILSKDLADNKKKNLDLEQVESAEIIYKSGHDLLILINEVLDLSKIEAGKMSVNIDKIRLNDFINETIRGFKNQAELKGLFIKSSMDSNIPEFIHTDYQRLSQILKNLLSNAIKFTEKGGVEIRLERYSSQAIALTVSDTGIGVAEDKQKAIFEAFQQADGGTSRKYGGTGLGLSISRELAKLLGAEIKLTSKPNEGAAFSLILPIELAQSMDQPETAYRSEKVQANKKVKTNGNFLNYATINDDRNSLTQNDKVVLIIEDDLNFASILKNQAHQKGFKCLSAASGEDGLVLVTKYHPDAIILDIELPGINGHQVLQELKLNPEVRHIPVHIMSGNERTLSAIKDGAIEYLMKPVNKEDLDKAFGRIEGFISRKMKNLLIVEDHEGSRKAIKKLIGNGDVKCLEAGTGKDSLALYKENHIDCIVLDLGLPDINGFELIQEFKKIVDKELPPIIVYTGKELTREENYELEKYAESIIIKGVRSDERLLDETALFLHRTISNLPEAKQVIINNLYDKEAIFHNKKILLVDDDMRNIFSLSKILKERGMDILKAENGKIALEMLLDHEDTDMVLMDIMMPEMDGYEAMQRIRAQDRFKYVPIIALTAKAMKDDKQKCVDAGASDYISKPVDIDRLLSLMRVWLSK